MSSYRDRLIEKRRKQREEELKAKEKKPVAKPDTQPAAGQPAQPAKPAPKTTFQPVDNSQPPVQVVNEPPKGKLANGISATGATKKSDEQAQVYQHQKEYQAQGHKNQLELQQKSQDFQREREERQNAEWYARQEYLRNQKAQRVRWSFRGSSTGMSSKSRWKIDVQRGNGGQPVRDGRIGIPERGPDGRSSLQMNGPALDGRRLGGDDVRRPDGGVNRPATGRSPGVLRQDLRGGFKFENRPTTVAEDFTNAQKGLKPEDRDPLAGTKDRNGVTFEQKLNMLAEATASGGKASIAHKAVDAAGKPVAGTENVVSIEADGRERHGDIVTFTNDGSGANVTSGAQGFASAIRAQEEAQGRAPGSLGSNSARVAEIDRAQMQQRLAKAGVQPAFKLSDFKERRQGRDGKYYDV